MKQARNIAIFALLIFFDLRLIYSQEKLKNSLSHQSAAWALLILHLIITAAFVLTYALTKRKPGETSHIIVTVFYYTAFGLGILILSIMLLPLLMNVEFSRTTTF